LSSKEPYDAPIDQVWNALTNNDELKKWYFKLEEFKPELGFKFDFLGGEEGGEQYLHLCEVVEVEEGKKISYTWRYDNYPGNSKVTWELLAKGEQTLVRLTHTGLETFAENGKNFARESFNGGWTYFLGEALQGYLNAN
jgi:uncharacterized protein YndB with AHSA1/START domain